jgi:hypothetical protein
MITKNKNLRAQLVLVMAAVGWGLFVLGPRPLNIFDLNWLWGDLAQTYTAWSQFNKDQNTNWLNSNRLSYPLVMNFSLFDPMPLLLITLGVLSKFVPNGTQFFGIYFIFCLILQGVLGYQIIRSLMIKGTGQNSAFACFLCGIFFIITPCAFYRFQQHTALASQWLLELSILISITSREYKFSKWIISNSAVTFLVSGFNPYLTFMVLISQFSVVLFDTHNIKDLKISVVKLASLFAVAIFGFYIFGYLDAVGVSNAGYGSYSMNMLGLIDSNGWGALFDLDITDPTGSQTWEGFNYQGLGILLLVCIVPLIMIRGDALKNNVIPVRAGAFIIVISYLLSLSTHVTWGSNFYDVPIPQVIKNVLGAFRSSGRIFWIGGFWILVLSLSIVCLKIKKPLLILFLGLILVIQFVDVVGVGSYVRNKITTTERTTYYALPSNLNISDYKGLIVIPPWQCDEFHNITPAGDRNYESFGFFAAQNGLYTNNFYAARTLANQRKYHCDIGNLSFSDISKENLYVFKSEFFNKIDKKIQEKFSCTVSGERGNDFLICHQK